MLLDMLAAQTTRAALGISGGPYQEATQGGGGGVIAVFIRERLESVGGKELGSVLEGLPIQTM
jgi:hypothetical protein